MGATMNEAGQLGRREVMLEPNLTHMAEGLGAFAEWLSTPADDATAHVAELRVVLSEVLGPPTTGDPARSQAERRADFEREIRVAIDQVFRKTSPS